MELLFIFVPILGFLLVKNLLMHQEKARADNLRLLAEALKNPVLDRAMIESLTYQLTGHRPPRSAGPSRLMAILLAFGWVAMFTGAGLWGVGWFVETRDLVVAGILTAIVGFGLVTYPFALRELEFRRQPQ